MKTDYILIIEDDLNIAELIKTYLEKNGYETANYSTAEDALHAVSVSVPKLVILDLSLPGKLDGLEFLKKLRTISAIPVIILTARGDEFDKVLGLELGSDDYMTKPFSPKELVARVKAILRRYNREQPTETLSYGPIFVNLASREAYLNDELVELTAKEFTLLVYLLRHKGMALSRKQILEAVWGPGWFGDQRTVDVHIRQLRKKFKDHFKLSTVWGIGYRLS